MARYNSKRIYNRLIPNGGARYNSAPFSINIFDYSNVIIDNIKNVTRNTNIQDSNTTKIENITFGFNVSVYDNIVILEKTVLLIDTETMADLGHGQETINNQSNSNYSDTGRGNDNINLSPLMLLLNELSKHTDNINIHPLTIALSQTLNINETINFDTVLLEFIDNINSSENTLFDSNINIEDNSQGSDNLSQIISNILTNELGNGVEVINLLPLSIDITDNNSTINDNTSISSTVICVDSGNGIENVTYHLGTFYNTKLSYNKGYNKGGANYNTSKQFVIMLFENGTMTVATEITPDRLSMADSNNTSNDTILSISSMSPISELINAQEGFVLFPHMIIVDEKGHTSISTDVRLVVDFNDSSVSTSDSTLLNIDVNTLDEGTGVDLMSFINAILNIKDNANILENVNLLPLLIELLDNEKFIDNTYINSSFDVNDIGNAKDTLSLPLMQVNTSDNLSLADLINIELSDINLIDNVLINEFANISNDIFLNDENISAIDIVIYRSGVFYNTKLQYNKGINKGGNIYNSSKHLIIVVSESGNVDEKEAYAVLLDFIDNINSSENTLFDSNINIEDNSQGSDNLSQIISNILTNELGDGIEAINILPLLLNMNDSNLLTNEATNINSVVIYSDNGNITDILSLPLMQVNASDNFSMADLIDVAFSDINLIDNILINELANISNDIFLNDENISAIDIVVYRSGVFYNTKLQYNRKLNDNGAIYNSSKHLIIVISESGNIDEKEAYIVQAYFVYDNGQGNDNSNITNELSKLFDNGTSADSFKNIVNNVTVIDLSKLNFQDEATFARLVDVIDKIIANDYVRKAETHFIVDSEGILQPLGIQVSKTTEGILPFTKDYTEEIPGMHGEYYLKSELKGKVIELEVVTSDGLTPEVKSELKEKIAKYLNPTKNTEKPLTFSDDLEKQYLVRYSGKIDIDNYPQWFKFVIPFKMSSPLIRGSFDNILIGSGTITNEGNTDANMIININGLADNPTIELDGQILTYNGTIEYGQTVVIDTEKKTVMMGDINVLNNWCGIFPTLKPGNTNVIMNGNISIRWRNAWL